MSSKRLHGISLIVFGLLALVLAGCGGTKILKEPEPVELEGPIAGGRDASVAAGLDWVIVRDGPGTWARNADWDEYLIRVRNVGDSDVKITNVLVYDSLDSPAEPIASRRQLVRESKAVTKRYKNEGLKVKAGLGGGTLAVTAGAVAVGGLSTGAAALGATSSAAALGATAVAAMAVAPVIAVGGVMRGVNNSKVSRRIEERSSELPIEIGVGEEATIDLFYPLSPSPLRMEINYSTPSNEQTLVIDTSVVLNGLHLGPGKEQS